MRTLPCLTIKNSIKISMLENNYTNPMETGEEDLEGRVEGRGGGGGNLPRGL